MKVYVISVLSAMGWWEVARTPKWEEKQKWVKKYEADGFRVSCVIKNY